MTCTKWWYESEVSVNQAMSGLASTLWFEMNNGVRHPVHVDWDKRLNELAHDEHKDSLETGSITSFEVVDVTWSVDDSAYWPEFEVEIGVTNPETGAEIKLWGEVKMPPGISVNADVTLREVLESEHASICDWDSTDPLSAEGGQLEPINICSGTTAAWKGT